MIRIVIAVLMFSLVAGCAHRIELQGHRGARGLLPENTIPAFAKAIELGVDVLEMDALITKDGVAVIGHDPCLNADLVRRAPTAWLAPAQTKGPCVRDLTFADLQQFDVGRIRPGSDYAKRFPAQIPIDGTTMPRLADVVAMAKNSTNPRIRFSIETKLSPFQRHETLAPEAIVDVLMAEIEKQGLMDRVMIQSFDWRTLKIVQQKHPGVPTVYLSAQQTWLDNINAQGREGSAWTAGLNARDFAGSVPKMVWAAGGKVWSPYFGDVDEDKLREARALGLRVIVWTVNSAKDLERMIALKVDGIITDYPDRAIRMMRQKELR
jgi:glycerophosphoryl diester phosphodiesterase